MRPRLEVMEGTVTRETRATEAELTRSYFYASDKRDQLMFIEYDHELALAMRDEDYRKEAR